jgi:putative DNA primase/helicase
VAAHIWAAIGHWQAPMNQSSAAEALVDADGALISELARLSPLAYARRRNEAAEQLQVGVSSLDGIVRAEQRRNGHEDRELQGRALNFCEPEPWPTHVDGTILLNELATVVRKYVVMPEHAADALALWIAHTYLIDCFEISPRLAITAPEKGCGKSTLLDVLGPLVYRPLPTANATAAAIFRVVEMQRPTLLVDEVDTFLPEDEELRGILNSGHKRGGSVIRLVGEDHEPRQFSTFSACAVAGIGKLPDTLADRSIPIVLRRRRPDEQIESFRSDQIEHFSKCSSRIVRWAIDNADRICGLNPRMPDNVINRAADNWRPLLAIADAAGGEWHQRARGACTILTTREDGSIGVMLLTDIRDIFAARGVDRLASDILAKALATIEGHPWAEWGRNEKAITPTGVARLLKRYAIVPDSVRIGGRTPKGYRLDQFAEAFSAYLGN